MAKLIPDQIFNENTQFSKYSRQYSSKTSSLSYQGGNGFNWDSENSEVIEAWWEAREKEFKEDTNKKDENGIGLFDSVVAFHPTYHKYLDGDVILINEDPKTKDKVYTIMPEDDNLQTFLTCFVRLKILEPLEPINDEEMDLKELGEFENPF